MATNGLVVMTPSTIAYSGTSASINADGSVDFSAVTSLSLNGVFTSDYDNYMIACRSSATTDSDVRVRFRNSGVDATAANYAFQYLYALSTTVVGGRSTSQTAGRISYVSSSLRQGFSFYVFGPFLSQPTAGRSVTALDFPYTGSPAYIDDGAITHSVSTSYDGITIYPGSGSITGLVTIFGFAQ